MTSVVDYASSYFEFPTLDKIHGPPTFRTLQTMRKQLKANCQTVISDLGGGRHGLLGLLLSPAEYALLSNVAFLRPQHPGQLQIPAGTPQHEAIRLREEHRENIRIFRETLDVETVLIKQVVSAIDPDYLKELRDPVTDKINVTIAEVLDHLFATYGLVDSVTLDECETKVKNMFWTLSDPPVTIFNAIEDLVELAEAANLPKSQAQIINFGLAIIRKTSDFEQALTAWYSRPHAEHTWQHFKSHFVTAHRALKKVRGPTMQNTAFHQAHLMAEHVADDIQQLKSEVLAKVDSLVTPQPVSSESVPTPVPAMYASTLAPPSSSDTELLRLIAHLQQQLLTLQTSPALPPGGGRPTRHRRTVSKYCWTHGACAHDGKECKNKSPEHHDGATFANKMGGSTTFCKKTDS